jgi:serine phosphatase RsbU (regulator of sigma subunit)
LAYPTREVKTYIRNRLALLLRFSRRTTVTLALVLGLSLAFAYATHLSYYGSQRLDDAFTYQTHVVDALSDASLLEVQQFDRGADPDELAPYERELTRDLGFIDSAAQTPEERAPAFAFPGTRQSFGDLTDSLLKLKFIGTQTFQATVRRNQQTRDLSNALFALVALLFTVLVGRLRRTIEEGRSLVERLQRAFISERRSIASVDVGSVLISATRGSNVGGDTYDAFSFDARHAMFLVADVSGKGIDAAVDTALIKYTIRTLFYEDSDPGRILSTFAQIYTRTSENPEVFIVLFLAVVDLEDGSVRYASAGHEPAWVLRGREVTILPPTGPIVGIRVDEGYETRALALAAGEGLVISTDGLTESRDARGDLLGADGVGRWLEDLDGSSAQAMAESLVRRLRRRSSRITDDLAILIVRFKPSAVIGRTDRTATVPALSISDAGT